MHIRNFRELQKFRRLSLLSLTVEKAHFVLSSITKKVFAYFINTILAICILLYCKHN